MVVPLVMGDVPAAGHGHHVAASIIGLAGILWSGIMPALIHIAGYLLATGAIAVIVYERVGLRFLRKAWVKVTCPLTSHFSPLTCKSQIQKHQRDRLHHVGRWSDAGSFE